MAEVSVLLPYKKDSLERETIFDFVLRWWHQNHPTWETVIGEQPTELDGISSLRPWCKAEAYRDALRAASGEILVLTDADVVFNAIAGAVALTRSAAPVHWCRGHDMVYRLNVAGSRQVMSGAGDWNVIAASPPLWEQWPYAQKAVGAGTVIEREVYERIPHDPRFLGWGSEDTAWGLALQTLAGPGPVVANAKCLHLWHPPQLKELRGGSVESQALLARYREAFHAVDAHEQMEKLVAEAADAFLPTLR